MEALIVLSPPPHFDVEGQAEAPRSSPGSGEEQEYSASGTSGRALLSGAYLAGGWYWHRQPFLPGAFHLRLNMWTRPQPREESSGLAASRGGEAWSCAEESALLLSRGAPPSIPASIHVQLFPHLRLARPQTPRFTSRKPAYSHNCLRIILCFQMEDRCEGAEWTSGRTAKMSPSTSWSGRLSCNLLQSNIRM